MLKVLANQKLKSSHKKIYIMEPSVEYYSKDFDWSTLQTKYQPLFESKAQDLSNPVPLSDYEKSWETFYQINQENFFKDRKYLVKSFEEIQEICSKTRKTHNSLKKIGNHGF